MRSQSEEADPALLNWAAPQLSEVQILISAVLDRVKSLQARRRLELSAWSH